MASTRAVYAMTYLYASKDSKTVGRRLTITWDNVWNRVADVEVKYLVDPHYSF